MSFPRYPEYKDSGVEWLGEIPAHWELKRLKNNLSLLTEKTGHRSNPVALENIESWSGRFIRTESEFEGEGVAFKEGDILFGKLRPYLAKVLLANQPGEAVGDFHVMRPKEDIQPRFAQYEILSRAFIDVVDGSTFGSKMPRASWDFMASMPFPTPPSDEQTLVANFLDCETAKIDALVAEQKKLMALLKEKRQAVISHAVTKGLDPAVPMKDSGVEWLGEVPAHWVVVKIKRLCKKITDGAHISPDTNGGSYHFVSTRDIYSDRIFFDDSLLTTLESYDYLVRSGCRPEVGDVLFSKDGTIGRTVVVRDAREFVVASSLIIIRPDPEQLLPDYLNFVCKSKFISSQVERFVKGAGLPRLSIQNLLRIIGVFPPVQEQEIIVRKLQFIVSELGGLIEQSENSIVLLQERRVALISAAVTGKIDVRGLTEAKAP